MVKRKSVSLLFCHTLYTNRKEREKYVTISRPVGSLTAATDIMKEGQTATHNVGDLGRDEWIILK
jgi:hypothetical protein